MLNRCGSFSLFTNTFKLLETDTSDPDTRLQVYEHKHEHLQPIKGNNKLQAKMISLKNVTAHSLSDLQKRFERILEDMSKKSLNTKQIFFTATKVRNVRYEASLFYSFPKACIA